MWSQSLTLKHAKIKIVEKPIADAVGLQIDMNSQKGNLIVNIGQIQLRFPLFQWEVLLSAE